VKLRHGFVSPAIAVSPAPTFAVALPLVPCCPPPAPSAKAAHGFSGYAGAPLAVLHFVARRRLPAVKRTAAMPGRVSLQGQDRATCCIAHPFGGYAAKTLPRPVLIPAPFRRSHTAKANPLRGIASQNKPVSASRLLA
jgi:hypothetical protein